MHTKYPKPQPLTSLLSRDEIVASRRVWSAFLNVPVNFESSTGLLFTLIPPGEFLMGMNKHEEESGMPDPKQQHAVQITKPLYFATTRVTQGQYKQIVGNNPSYFEKYQHNFFSIENLRSRSRFPVERVSWFDAVEFCDRLSCLDNRRYRLPSEAEWEYVCRAGTREAFHFGPVGNGSLDNFDGRQPYGTSKSGKYRGWACAVAKYPPNNFGVYDLHGNVSEWCNDWYSPEYYSTSPTKDPCGPPDGKERVYRGGCFASCGSMARSAIRRSADPKMKTSRLGIRIACDIDLSRN